MRPRKAHRFDRMETGVLTNPNAKGPVRMSTAARLLRAQGQEAAAAELEAEAKVAAPWCIRCERSLPDPVIAILSEGGGRVAYACPWCSGPDILAAWEAEAPKEGG